MSETVDATAKLYDLLAMTENGSIYTSPVSMASLYHPETLLSALRQTCARNCMLLRHVIVLQLAVQHPMDELHLSVSWMWEKGVPKSSVRTLAIEGLLIQGARFDGRHLSACEPSDPIFCTVPICLLTFVKLPNATESLLQVPLYAGAQRDRLLGHLGVPVTLESRDSFILYGTAFLLQAET